VPEAIFAKDEFEKNNENNENEIINILRLKFALLCI
jgi:hypothetical protein